MAEQQEPTITSSPAAGKKSNKTLWIVLGVLLFVFIILPAIVISLLFFVFKDKVSESISEGVVETAIEQASGNNVDIDANNDSFSIKSEDGNSELNIGGSDLPSDFPKNDVPFINPKEVTFSASSEQEGKKYWNVGTTVDQSYDEAVNFFKEKIAAPEYTDVGSYSFGESSTITGTKAPYTVSVSVSNSEGQTNVTYIIQQQ